MDNLPLSGAEVKKLRKTFQFLQNAYRAGLVKTKFASDYSHFYILCTTLLSGGSIFPDPISDTDKKVLTQKLIEFGKQLEKTYRPEDTSNMAKYLRLSRERTTDAKKTQDSKTYLRKFLKIYEIWMIERFSHPAPRDGLGFAGG